METVKFFSQLATRIGYGTISDRSGVTRPTVGKLLSYKAHVPKKRSQSTPLVLDALKDLAIERAAQLRKEAQDIENHIPALDQWKEELLQA